MLTTVSVWDETVLRMHPHGVDYTRTSDRLRWRDVPVGAVAALGRALGSPVASATAPVGAGFGGQYAGTLELADGRAVFPKAAPQDLEFPAASLRREGAVLPLLPDGVPHARLLAVVESDGWVLLAVEHLVGRMPGQAWTQDDLSVAYDACVATTTPAAPAVVADSQFRDAVRRDDWLVATEQRLAAGELELPTTYGRDDWLSATTQRHGRELAELSRSATDLLAGDALCHNDLRPDNLILTEVGAIFIDWNFVTLAPRWLDFVGLLPMAYRQGLDLSRWWASALLADAEPEQLDAFLAVIGVYMLSTQALSPPPGCTTSARTHQLVFAGDFVGLLAHRRGWGDP